MLDLFLSIPIIGRKIEKRKIKNEGGEMSSLYLRRITLQRYNTDVGLYTYGGCFSKDFNVGGKVTVGRYCSIAKDVHYFGANHPIESVTTSALFYNKRFGYDVKDVKREELSIGNDVWIGYGVIITAGCHKIGDGAVIAAGAVVTKNVDSYEIVGGVPAKHIGFRFKQDIIERISNTKWYEMSPDELMNYYRYFENPDLFCSKLEDRA